VPEPDSKRCTRCGETKPLTEFNRKDRGRLQGYCRACNSAYLKEHYAKNKEYYAAKARKNTRLSKINAITYIWRYFETHPCVDCGETDPVVLQFDHVRGEKSFAIATMVSTGFSAAKIEAEIAKCEVRCANCHFRKTAKERGWYRYMQQ
jgi:recombinational DNA repair protein (RecF pathway)